MCKILNSNFFFFFFFENLKSLRNLNLEGIAHLTNTSIYGELNFISATLSLSKTNIGNFSVTNLQDVVKMLIYFVLPMVNNELKAGFKLPITNNIELVSPTLTFGQDYLAITTNVKYTGSAIVKPKKGRSHQK
jgi:hypothetical protein